MGAREPKAEKASLPAGTPTPGKIRIPEGFFSTAAQAGSLACASFSIMAARAGFSFPLSDAEAGDAILLFSSGERAETASSFLRAVSSSVFLCR